MSEFEEVIDTATTDGEMSTESTEQVATGDTAQVEQTTTQETTQETPQERHERMFGQADVDRILQTRLAKEKQRFESELKNNPRLTYLEQLAQESGMSVDQLIENDRKFREQEKINKLIQQNIPPELAKEVYENRKFREETTAEKKAREESETKEKEANALKERGKNSLVEFLNEYPEYNTQEKWATIPPELYAEHEKWVKSWGREGRSLTDSFARHLLKQNNMQQQTIQANEKNAGTSTGSVKNVTKSQSQDPFLDGFNSVR